MKKLLSILALSTLVLSTTPVYAGFSEANLKLSHKGPRPSVEIKRCSLLSADEQKKDKLCSQYCEKGDISTYKGIEYKFYPANCGIEPNHDTYYFVEK